MLTKHRKIIQRGFLKSINKVYNEEIPAKRICRKTLSKRKPRFAIKAISM